MGFSAKIIYISFLFYYTYHYNARANFHFHKIFRVFTAILHGGTHNPPTPGKC